MQNQKLTSSQELVTKIYDEFYQPHSRNLWSKERELGSGMKMAKNTWILSADLRLIVWDIVIR